MASMTTITAHDRRRAARLAPVIALACTLAMPLMLAGCGSFGETLQRGYVLPEGALEQIPIGATQEQVLIVLGTPSTVARSLPPEGDAFFTSAISANWFSARFFLRADRKRRTGGASCASATTSLHGLRVFAAAISSRL